MNSNLRIAGFQVFSVAKIAIVCLVCFSSDLRGLALHKSRRGRPQLLDPRPWCVWQTLATARSSKLTTPRPTKKVDLTTRTHSVSSPHARIPKHRTRIPILPQFRRFGSGPPPRTKQPQPRRGWGEGSVGSKLQRKFSCEWFGTVTVARGVAEGRSRLRLMISLRNTALLRSSQTTYSKRYFFFFMCGHQRLEHVHVGTELQLCAGF